MNKATFTQLENKYVRTYHSEMAEAVLLCMAIEEGWQVAAERAKKFAAAQACIFWRTSVSGDVHIFSTVAGSDSLIMPGEHLIDMVEHTSYKRGVPRRIAVGKNAHFSRLYEPTFSDNGICLLCPIAVAGERPWGMAHFLYTRHTASFTHPGQTAELMRSVFQVLQQHHEQRRQVEKAKRLVQSVRRLF